MRSRHKLAPPLGPSPACVTQSCFKAFLELFPALLLRVCAALYSRKVMLYRCHSLIMLAHCLFELCLGFLHRSFPQGTCLRRSGFFLLPLSFAAPLLFLERGSGAAVGLLINFLSFGGFCFCRPQRSRRPWCRR